jgi:hypothetical protein
MDKHTQNTAYNTTEKGKSHHQNKDNIQRKGKRHNTAKLKENPRLT